MKSLIMLSTVLLTGACGLYFLVLYFKIDKIKDEVDEIKRKMVEEE